MRLSQYIDRQPAKHPKSRAKPASTLSKVAAQRFFVPAMMAWGATVLGLTILVLPAETINRLTVLTNFDALGDWAMTSYVAIAAVLGGVLAFFVSGSMHERARTRMESGSVVSVVHSRRAGDVDPINPAVDLGSESLDAPIEDGEFEELREVSRAKSEKPQPTLGELSRRGYEMEAPEDQNTPKNAGDDGGDISFTRKHFQSALIEACEAESCEAAAGEAKPENDPAKEDTMAQVMTTAKRDNEPAPIGSPAAARAGASWSLTQFTPPSPEAAPLPKVSASDEAKAPSPVKVVPDPAHATVKEASDSTKPRALDLAEFAQLPGRNAVWVEDAAEAAPAPQDEPDTAPVRVPSAPAAETAPKPGPLPASALEKLRQKNPEELSLVEMVERFAGALHEHQAAERAIIAKRGPSRDAALAEALKALTLFTERGFDKGGSKDAANGDLSQLGQTERELRDALTQLQGLRGETRGAA